MNDPFEMETQREGYRVQILRGPLAGQTGEICQARTSGGSVWVWLDNPRANLPTCRTAVRGNVRGLQYLPTPRKELPVPLIDNQTHVDQGAVPGLVEQAENQ